MTDPEREGMAMIIKDASVHTWTLILFSINAVLIAVLCIIERARRTQRTKNKEDERYQLLNAKAYQKAFYTILIWAALYLSLCLILNRPLMAHGLCLVTGVCLAAVVYHIYCILYDISLDKRLEEGKFPWIDLIIGLGWGIKGIRVITAGELVHDGMLTYDFISVLTAILWLSTPAGVLIQRRMDNRRETEDGI